MFEFESSGSFNPADESHSVCKIWDIQICCCVSSLSWLPLGLEKKKKKNQSDYLGESVEWLPDRNRGLFVWGGGWAGGAQLPRGGWQDRSARWERWMQNGVSVSTVWWWRCWEQSGRFMRGKTETRFKSTAMFVSIRLWEIDEEEAEKKPNRFCKIVPDPVQIYWLSEGTCCCDFIDFIVLRSLLCLMLLAGVLSGYLWRPQVRGRS